MRDVRVCETVELNILMDDMWGDEEAADDSQSARPLAAAVEAKISSI